MLVIPRFGGGGDKQDINEATLSQTALWKSYAKDWNKFITQIEPRTDAAFKTALQDPTSRVTSEMKSGVYGQATPQAVMNNQGTTNLMRMQPKLGSALAMADVKGAEAAKDYQSNTLSNILTSKLGQKTNNQTALGTLATNEANQFMKDYTGAQEANAMMGQGTSSAAFSSGVGLYKGLQ